jgi:hypothetical protein
MYSWVDNARNEPVKTIKLTLSTVGVRLVRAVCAVLLSITDPGERVAFTRSAGKLVTVTNGTVMG